MIESLYFKDVQRQGESAEGTVEVRLRHLVVTIPFRFLDSPTLGHRSFMAGQPSDAVRLSGYFLDVLSVAVRQAIFTWGASTGDLFEPGQTMYERTDTAAERDLRIALEEANSIEAWRFDPSTVPAELQ